MKAGLITAASIGQTCSVSQGISERSSATPRSRVIGLWVWALTRPGISTAPGRLTRSRGAYSARACSRGSSARMRPSSTTRAWSSSTSPAGSTGTIQPASTTSAQARWAPAAAGLLDAADVLTGPGVDADDFFLADEQRHAHGGAGLELGRLAAAARGVAAHARIGLDDLELDEVRRLHRDRRAVPQRHHAGFLALEVVLRVADAGRVGLHLLERLGLHEVP